MVSPFITDSDATGVGPPDSRDTEFSSLLVTRKELVAHGIYLFELRHPQGQPLAAFDPGSHLTVEVPNGARRNYSLCSAPGDLFCYQIAVKRDEGGRGGSRSLADDVQPGQRLSVSAPRNNFELAKRAKRFVFVAGGIGITPILSMMRHLKRSDTREFKLYYLTRDAATTAFLLDIQLEFPGHVEIHHDNGDPGQALDMWPLFEKPSGAHIYCCGPKGLMDSVQDMTGHWPTGTVHFESFGVDAKTHADNKPFQVRLQSSGDTIQVGAQESILEALRKHGLRISSSCESGTCGSCKTHFLAGEPEHRDMVLSEEEQSDQIMVCVSRAISPELVLDL